jgi:hypothetical protein
MSYNSPFTGNVIQPTDVSFRSITLSANTQLAWPINGNVDGDYTARIMEVTATAPGLELWMPPANQASVGQDALIRNVGANSFDVRTFNDQAAIVTVAPSQARYIYIEDNPNASGSWGVIAFGVGTSNVDAATLAGYGLLALSNTLNASHPVTTFASNTTATDAFRAQSYVWVGGAGTFTLPSSSSLGNNWFMLLRNSGNGTLTVSTTGGDLFNGSTTVGLQAGDSCIIVCSGSAYYSVGLGRATQFNFTQLTYPVTNGTYTLTSNEASNVIMKFTGTLSGNVVIVVPETIQVYYIQNSTDGTVNNYTVTIRTAVSGASVAIIPAGQQATLVCDSVNIFNANTILAGSSSISLIDGTVGAPALNFGSEPTTGIYRGAAGQFDISILGVNRFILNATGLEINGSGNFTGGVSGGVFP